jgi:hypothetical protein
MVTEKSQDHGEPLVTTNVCVCVCVCIYREREREREGEREMYCHRTTCQPKDKRSPCWCLLWGIIGEWDGKTGRRKVVSRTEK